MTSYQKFCADIFSAEEPRMVLREGKKWNKIKSSDRINLFIRETTEEGRRVFVLQLYWDDRTPYTIPHSHGYKDTPFYSLEQFKAKVVPPM